MSRVQRLGELLVWRKEITLSRKFSFFDNKYKVSCLSLLF